MEGVVADRPNLPSHPSLRPACLHDRRQQSSVHGVVLPFLEKQQMLLVRRVEREPASVKQDTHDRPHGATNLHPAGTPVTELLEAQHPTLRTRVR